MRGNLAAFLAACDGASDCTGACKEAFYSKYAGCVRGYVPVLVDGGFRNATLKAALDLCAPNSRATPLPLHFDVALDTDKPYGPVRKPTGNGPRLVRIVRVLVVVLTGNGPRLVRM